MGSVTYYVAMGFERSEEGDVVAMEAMESQSSRQAVSRARALAATKAGAVAFSRAGDPDIGEFADAVVLFMAGEVPDALPTG
jgi:short-subunit dehydrogenase